MSPTLALRLLCVCAAWVIAAGPARADEDAGGAAAPPASPCDVLMTGGGDGGDVHEALFVESCFPSAHTCAACHPKQFAEWSVSQHAYSQISPVFNAFQATVLQLTNGTNGDFCIRCHDPVGMNLSEPLLVPNEERSPTSREGITCITCHRISSAYGKVSGRLAIDQGDIFSPVYGPSGEENLKKVLAEAGTFALKTSREDEVGRQIHLEAPKFFQLNTPGTCSTCHDVTLMNGFRLEEAYGSYRNSPAAARGQTCQDCHMATIPGVASEYARGPAAVLGGVPTPDRKLTNHRFAGPDYSVVHPGIFPHDPEATKLATISEWTLFDYQAGWGVRDAERALPEDYVYPDVWRSRSKRRKARRILARHQELLREISDERLQVLRAGYQLGEVVVDRSDESGLRFRVEVKNGTDGHTVPVGFIAERQVYLHVTVHDAGGKLVLESGDLDPNGDVRDLHSLYVHDGKLPLDKQLFSLQSRFLVQNLRGSEREQVLAVNYSIDPLPYIRPSSSSTILTGRPAGVRIHHVSLSPGGNRWAKYRVRSRELTGRAPYTARVELIAGMVPVNLLNDIQSLGFDYGMSAKDIGDAIAFGLTDHSGERFTDGHQILWEREIVLEAGVRQTASAAAGQTVGQ